MLQPTIEDAILLATEAHRGQKDKAGLPYILHPLRAMSFFVLPEEEEERMVAVMHDLVEDTEVTLAYLQVHAGYSRPVCDAVNALTRRPGESYMQYIERVAQNPLATKVKLADLRDNLDPRRESTQMLSVDTPQKYRDARLLLQCAADKMG